MNKKRERNFKAISEALSQQLSITQTETDKLKCDLGTLASISNREITALKERVSNIQSKLKEEVLIGMANQRKACGVNKHGRQIKTGKRSNHLKFNSSHQQTCLNTNQIILLTQGEQNSKAFQERLLSENRAQPEHKQIGSIFSQKVEILLNEYINRNELQKVISSLRENINAISVEIKTSGEKESTQKQIDPASTQVAVGEAKSRTEENELKNWMQNLNRQLSTKMKDMSSEIDEMKTNVEELKQLNGERKRKQNRVFIQIDDLAKNQKKLFSKVQANNESSEAQFKQLKKELQSVKSSSYLISHVASSSLPDKNIHDGGLISDIIQKMQVSLQKLVTRQQFLQFKQEIQFKISTGQTQSENVKTQSNNLFAKLSEDLGIQSESIQETNKNFQQIKDRVHFSNSLNEKNISIAVARVEDIKTTLQTVKEDLQFYKSMNLNLIDPRLNSQVSKDESGTDCYENTNKLMKDFKRCWHQKLYEQRVQFINLIRDAQKKFSQREINPDLTNKLAEMNLFLNKKVNQEDLKKSLSHLEKRLGNLEDKTSQNENDDARIGKRNWLCLSCDKSLQNYHGKTGQHIAWDSITPKNNQISWDSIMKRIGHTRSNSRQDTKKSLPTLKR